LADSLDARIAARPDWLQDVSDPVTYAQHGVPHKTFDWIRANEPVFWTESAEGYKGFWTVSKFDDICRISKDPGTFSSFRGGTNIEDYDEYDLNNIRMMLINMDPPQHVKFRRLVKKGFTPRMVAIMEPQIRDELDDIFGGLPEGREGDFVTNIAAELPLRVICRLMGVPFEDRGKIFDWSNRLIGFSDPEYQTSLEDGRMAAMELWMYAESLAEARRGTEGEDLVRVLLNATVDGDKLTEMEFDSFMLLLSVAGNETTRNAISAGLLTLLEHPEQWERLKNEPELIPTAVEEILRWHPPVMYFRRTATADCEVRGQQIKEDDKLCIFYTSGNRDEDIFPDSNTFDITRADNPHLAFGVGQHFCLGASLARLEMKLLLEKLIEHMPDVRVTGPVTRLQSNFISGYKKIPVAW
jgi:cholest-4-en-3-one 26-monooxygenase